MYAMTHPKKEQRMDFKYRGIIWLLSPNKGSVPIARYGIGQHREKGQLEICWCIYGSDDEQEREALEARIQDLRKELQAFGYPIRIKPHEINKADAEHTFQAVMDIYQHKIQDYGLERSEVIADITGGFASMSAGMTLACSFLGADIEYIQVEFTKQGENMVPSQNEQSWHHILIEPPQRDLTETNVS